MAPILECISIGIQVTRAVYDPVVTMYDVNVCMWFLLTAFRVFCIINALCGVHVFAAALQTVKTEADSDVNKSLFLLRYSHHHLRTHY